MSFDSPLAVAPRGTSVRGVTSPRGALFLRERYCVFALKEIYLESIKCRSSTLPLDLDATVELNVLIVSCLFSLAVTLKDVAVYGELGWHVEVV